MGGTKPNLPTWLLRFGNTYTGYRSKPQAVVSTATNNGLGDIQGVITDANTGEPLPFVSVMASGNNTQLGTQTDFDGYYSIRPLTVGSYTVKVSYVGYNAQQINNVQVNANRLSFLDFTIAQSANVLDAVEVIAYKIPLLQADETSTGATYTNKDIQNLSSSTITRSATFDGKSKKKTQSTSAVSQANISENATNISFDIKLPYTIPNDGKTYVVDVNQYDVPASYRYYCVPKIDPDAFLTAEITNWEELNLLSGEANLFFEGTFVGKSMLNPNRTEDTLFLSLGRDKSIVVDRTKQKDFNKRQFIGSNRLETRQFDIAVRNKKSQAINLTIEDQYPISTDKDIDISVETDKEAKKNTETGAITWDIALPPATEKKLLLKYEVKYPKNKALVLE